MATALSFKGPRPRAPPHRSSDEPKKSIQAAVTSPMILWLVASPYVRACRDFAPAVQLPSLALSDIDRLDQRERAIVHWLSRQSASMVRKNPGLFSSSGDQQEQPFVQINCHHRVWIK
jgi:hypothetical protein